MMQMLDAAPYRGNPIRFRAAVNVARPLGRYPPHVLFTQTDPHRSRLFWQAARAVLFVAFFLHAAKD
jgi:hypothetical protein